MTAPDALMDAIYPPGQPEMLFRVGDVISDAAGSTGSMVSGSWMLGPDGEPSSGSLGVLIDNVLGSAILRDRPPDHWAVTTEMSVSLCSPVPADGQLITARSEVDHLDTKVGVAHGRVARADGGVIAVATQRLRFVAGAVTHDRNQIQKLVPEEGLPLLKTLGVHESSTAGRPGLELVPDRRLANPAGNVHGGILFTLSEIGGLLSVQSQEYPLRTGSVHLVFVRSALIGELLRFETETLYRGRTLAVAQVSGIRADGKVCSVATVTCHG